MQKKVIKTEEAPAPIGPYNQAILVNNTLYVSGQIPLDAHTGDLLSGDIVKETQQVMKNIGAILEAANMDFGNIVKISIFIRDMEQFGIVNKTYGAYFEEDPPTRETVEVSNLPKNAQIEMSCIAVP